MNRKPFFPAQLDYREILADHPVHPGFFEQIEQTLHKLHFPVVDNDIQGYKHLDPVPVGLAHNPPQFTRLDPGA